MIVLAEDSLGRFAGLGSWDGNRINVRITSPIREGAVVVGGFRVHKITRPLIPGDVFSIHLDEHTSQTLKHFLVKRRNQACQTAT